MSKEALKTAIIEKQNGECALSEAPLKPDLMLVDTDRILQKKDGGIYTTENTRVVDPVAHMKRHGNYRDREEALHELKVIMDGREKVRQHVNATGNRILAMERGTDDLDVNTIDWLKEQQDAAKKRLSKIDRKVKKHLERMPHEIINAALDVDSVGPITVAYMMIYIDIEKAPYVSSMWKYTGLHTSSHQRYKKGETSGGNKTLRTALYTMAESQIRGRGAYRDVYDRTKAKLEVSEKITKSRNTQGNLIECKWKDTKPSHRHGAAIRQIMKHFLADWWIVHRTLEGLDTPKPYPIEKLGHKNWIYPEERGWEY